MEFAKLLERLDEKLKGIADRITSNKTDQDDLMQEMRIYLWEKREEFKGKTESYILRACYFQAAHCYNRGKSIDSKPRKNVVILSLEDMKTFNYNGRACSALNGYSVLEEARDILIAEQIKESIRGQLNPKLRRTFDLLMEGYSLHEIAQSLNLTYEAVRLRVKKIRELARVYLEENLVFW